MSFGIELPRLAAWKEKPLEREKPRRALGPG
jgi:hypothetical protein